MRAARSLGISTFALWRLGSEDRSLWKVWDAPRDADAPEKLEVVDPGQDVDIEGEGDILRIDSKPSPGTRDLTVDNDGLITNEVFRQLPSPYRVDAYGAPSKRVVISFDDGPDPQWTPKVLDILKQYNVKAIFFTIGLEAEKYPGLLKRIYREGHEIGNHTFTHPDISNISEELVRVELNLTERLLAAKLGIKPALFRPPYSVDQEPDTADEVRPLELTQSMGYTTVGDKIDPDDWHENPRPTPEQITQSVMDQLSHGSIILLHDGGGNRANTVKALPMIIEGLRAARLSDRLRARAAGQKLCRRDGSDLAQRALLGHRRFGRLPHLRRRQQLHRLRLLRRRRADERTPGPGRRLPPSSTVCAAIAPRWPPANPPSIPPSPCSIPAYNEEKVIDRTIRSVLDSTYPEPARRGHRRRLDRPHRRGRPRELRRARSPSGRVTVLRQENGGKASALNYGLQFVTEEIFVGIDADTLIANDAIAYLVPHFQDPRVGAMAGNAKVGNRVNLWTRWQALEYITSQNFDRRALNTFSAVCVVPGAIGAWRTEAVRAASGYKTDTVAEDADLTMALLQNGYKVEYEDRALAYTEAPTTANGLMRQRFRWSFGILQAVWKHRSAFARKGALGYVALPNIVIFQILLPLVSPFIDIMFVVGSLKYLIWDKHFHPETRRPGQLPAAGAVLLHVPADRLHRLHHRLLAGAPHGRDRATGGCSDTSGCSASPIASSSPSC